MCRSCLVPQNYLAMDWKFILYFSQIVKQFLTFGFHRRAASFRAIFQHRDNLRAKLSFTDC
jgi:hypothetical protein